MWLHRASPGGAWRALSPWCGPVRQTSASLRQVFIAAGMERVTDARPTNNRVNGVSPEVYFRRTHDAPTMDNEKILATLGELRFEKCSDVFLLRALSRRFRASVEEFFPFQIDELLCAFAELSYSDEQILQGFVGRLDDVISDASPRRVVRLLRSGAGLRFQPDEWLDPVLMQLHRHLPNLREGVPSALASLHAMRWSDPELAELLLTQGLLVGDALGDSFLTRLLESWSRHGLRHSEAENLAASLARGQALTDIRDNLNLLTCLLRCSPGDDAHAGLEEELETRLRGASTEEALIALQWMRRLTLRSRRLWQACGDSVELALKEHDFVRYQLPDAIHALATLTCGEESEVLGEEVAFVARLLGAQETLAALPRYSAPQALSLLHAACLVALAPDGGRSKGTEALPWRALAEQAARLSRQLTLPERRILSTVAHVLADFSNRSNLELGPEHLKKMQSLSLAALPPLVGGGAEGPATQDAEHWSVVELGGEALLRTGAAGKGGRQQGFRFLGFGDVFAAPIGVPFRTTPTCRLTSRALELQGWQVGLRE